MSPHELDDQIKTLILSVKTKVMNKKYAVFKLNSYKEQGFDTSNQELNEMLINKIDHALEIVNRF